MARPPHPVPKPRAELTWAAVDFDGTIADTVWTPENPVPVLGKPMPHSLTQIDALVDAGYTIIIHTARPWSDHEAIELWLLHYRVPFNAIVCGKLLAAVYIDDRAVSAYERNWVESTDAIAR